MNEYTNAPSPNADMLRRLGVEDERPPVWWRRKRWVGAAVVATLILGTLLFFGDGAPPAYQVVGVARGDLLVSVAATGTLQPVDQVDVGAEISGRIDRILVDFNDHVVQGQVLAELDTEQLQAKMAQSQAALSAARANVAQNQATLGQTHALAARAEELFARNVVAMQDLEAARADLERAEANLQRAHADASLAAAQVAADVTTLSKAVIRSPIDGVVLNRLVEPGQAVAASFQTPVLFTLASDLSQMELLVDIDEADIGAVVEGQSASFTVDAFPQRRFRAELVSVRNAPTIAEGVVTYQGVLVVDNSSGLLRPGLTANADITVAQLEDVLLAPNGALRFTPSLEADELPPPPLADAEGILVGRVWVWEGARPSPRDLVIGRTDGTQTEIVSGALAEHENVIVDIGAATPRAGGRP